MTSGRSQQEKLDGSIGHKIKHRELRRHQKIDSRIGGNVEILK